MLRSKPALLPAALEPDFPKMVTTVIRSGQGCAGPYRLHPRSLWVIAAGCDRPNAEAHGEVQPVAAGALEYSAEPDTRRVVERRRGISSSTGRSSRSWLGPGDSAPGRRDRTAGERARLERARTCVAARPYGRHRQRRRARPPYGTVTTPSRCRRGRAGYDVPSGRCAAPCESLPDGRHTRTGHTWRIPRRCCRQSGGRKPR